MAQIGVQNNNTNHTSDDAHHHQHQAHTNESNPNPTVSYHDEEHKVFGCPHYARNCFLKASCCDEWYVCRLCHDENNEEHVMLDVMDANSDSAHHSHDHSAPRKPHKPHKMNRYSTQFAKCMRCGLEQLASKHCAGCVVEMSEDDGDDDTEQKGDAADASNHSNSSTSTDQCPKVDDAPETETAQKYALGRYFCDICKFYDDDPKKEIFHCAECGLCRLGRAEDYIHCRRCGCCLNYKYFAKHPCIENSLKSDCPICFTYLFKSRKPVTFWVPCGHPIHYDCLREYGQNAQYGTLCPVCRCRWFDEEAENRRRVVEAINQRPHVGEGEEGEGDGEEEEEDVD